MKKSILLTLLLTLSLAIDGTAQKVDLIDGNLDFKYETDWKESKSYNQLTTEMAIPEEVLF